MNSLIDYTTARRNTLRAAPYLCALLICLVGIGVASIARAQPVPEARSIPLSYYGSISASRPAAAVSVRVELETSAASANLSAGANGNFTTTIGTSYIDIGKKYIVRVTYSINGVPLREGQLASAVSARFHLAAPIGYEVIVNGRYRSSFDSAASSFFVVAVVPKGSTAPSAAGASSEVDGPVFSWQIGLGTLKNGNSAGFLSLVGRTEDTFEDLLKPDALAVCSADDREVRVYYTPGTTTPRQIHCPQSLVDIIATSPRSFEIAFYPSPSSVVSLPTPVSGNPFYKYRLETDNPSQMIRILKECRSLATPLAPPRTADTTEVTSMDRLGARNAPIWRIVKWTTNSVSPDRVEEIRREAVSVTDFTETEVSYAQGKIAERQSKKYFRSYPWGAAVMRVTSGSDESTFTEYKYLTEPLAGLQGLVEWERNQAGAVKYYTYLRNFSFTETQTSIARIAAPYLNENPGGSLGATGFTGLVTEFTYSRDEWGAYSRVASQITKVNETITEALYTDYSENAAVLQNGMPTVYEATVPRHPYFSSRISYSRGREFYRSDISDPYFAGQTHAEWEYSGKKRSYVRQRGALSGAIDLEAQSLNASVTFAPRADGAYSRIGVIHGTVFPDPNSRELLELEGYKISPLYVTPFKSTMKVEIRDFRGLLVRNESYVWSGSGWALVSWVNLGYNASNQLIGRYLSNGELVQYIYSGEQLSKEVHPEGNATSYIYNSAGLVATVRKEGGVARVNNGKESIVVPDEITEYAYDVEGNVIKKAVRPAAGEERLIWEWSYDSAGRLISEKTPGRGRMMIDYSAVERRITRTHPDGGTEVTTFLRDGQVSSITGTAVISRFFTYGVDSQGTRWTKEAIGRIDSPRSSTVWKDPRHNVVRRARPGVLGRGEKVETFEYDDWGRLSGIMDHGINVRRIFLTDFLGGRKVECLDVDGTGKWEAAGSDRASIEDTRIELRDGVYWKVVRTFGTPIDGSPAEVLVGVVETRLSGFSGNLRSEVIYRDGNDVARVKKILVDRLSKTTTEEITSSSHKTSSTTTSVSGVVVETRSFDENVIHFKYDGLRRMTGSVEHRTGGDRPSSIEYHPGTTQPRLVRDSSGRIVTTNEFDAMGRESAVGDSEGGVTRQKYSLRGEVEEVWGDNKHPVRFRYNEYGERIAKSVLTVFGEEDIGGVQPPSELWLSRARLEVWIYDEYSGALLKKMSGGDVVREYEYNPSGWLLRELRLEAGGGQRRWVTYRYDSRTGEMLSKEFSDGTPSLSISYDRHGRIKSVSDVTGARSFEYSPDGRGQLIRERLPAFLGGLVVEHLYENTNNSEESLVRGRRRGFALRPRSGDGVLLEHVLTRNPNGRVASVSSRAPSMNVEQKFEYEYGQNTHIVRGYRATATPFSMEYEYGDQARDLSTGLTAKWGDRILSSLSYRGLSAENRVGEIEGRGELYSEYGGVVLQRFRYNARNEIVRASFAIQSRDGDLELEDRLSEWRYDASGVRVFGRFGGPAANAEIDPVAQVHDKGQVVLRRNGYQAISGFAAPGTLMFVDSKPISRSGNNWHTAVPPSNDDSARGERVTILSVRDMGRSDVSALSHEVPTIRLPKNENRVFDSEGKLVEDSRYVYRWNGEGQLVAVEEKSIKDIPWDHVRRRIEMRYDYLGRRVSKKTFVFKLGRWNESEERRFLYDGWNLVAELDGLGRILRSFVWGLDIVGSLEETGGVGALLQVLDHQTLERFFVIRDRSGSVAALVAALDGQFAAKYEYSAFGEKMRATGRYAESNPLRFSSKYLDSETGLVYFDARYYEPRGGAFISRDPVDDNLGINPYAYCANDGVNNYEYRGLAWNRKKWKRIFVTAAVVAVGIYTGGAATAAFGSGFFGSIASAGVAGAAGGATGAALYGGNREEIRRSAISGAGRSMVYALATNVIAEVGDFERTASQVEGAESFGKRFSDGFIKAEVVNRNIDQFARRQWNMSSDRLNFYLTVASFAGDAMFGGRRPQENIDDKGRKNTYQPGVLSRTSGLGSLGAVLAIPFDLVDITLGYRGLPSATGWKMMADREWRESMRDYHSLGTLDGITLYRMGAIDGGRLLSVPFGNIVPTGLDPFLGNNDLVNGSLLGGVLNPGAQMITLQHSSPGHSASQYYDYINNYMD